MVVTFSEVSPTNASGQGTITWSCSLNGTARTVGATVTLPTNLQTQSNVYIIWGEVTYPYTPAMGYAVTGTINLYQSHLFLPASVELQSSINVRLLERSSILAASAAARERARHAPAGTVPAWRP